MTPSRSARRSMTVRALWEMPSSASLMSWWRWPPVAGLAGIISVQVPPISPANADACLHSIVIRGEWHLAGCCSDSGWMGLWVVVVGRGRE
jgi:hypothetical protein